MIQIIVEVIGIIITTIASALLPMFFTENTQQIPKAIITALILSIIYVILIYKIYRKKRSENEFQSEYIRRKLDKIYPKSIYDKLHEFSNTFMKQINFLVEHKVPILSKSKRNITISFADSKHKLIKVEIHKMQEYIYLPRNNYRIGFNAAEQQKDTYNLKKFCINHQNKKDQIKWLPIGKNSFREQFIFHIECEPIEILDTPAYIESLEEYVCPALDFYMSYKLKEICEDFHVDFTLDSTVREEYTLVASSFSAFKSGPQNDIQGNELTKTNINTSISLPKWSIPGYGYTVALEKRTKNNHI